jgi:hypothetical protein
MVFLRDALPVDRLGDTAGSLLLSLSLPRPLCFGFVSMPFEVVKAEWDEAVEGVRGSVLHFVGLPSSETRLQFSSFEYRTREYLPQALGSAGDDME